ncbi:hypothetical protein VFPPC_10079 [Pochonia chlamydosporia 170]|uniref:Uncharacterized protein n=1 Tax=Pochonia chlamydosporia 170 TaxID=1380566 RepID=A0A179F3I7_METCM|nr:hypothetical protein VFPPC_10079 [Pochonia chlamydosporia 170]OAQ59986.1 hypothetical protein VFPPC_10079 [Pochonia chlamydosporia 170]
MDAGVQDERCTIIEENQKLKGTLAQPEHITGLSDQNIQTTFKKLAREVDNFSRVAWDKRKQFQWPLPDIVLQRDNIPKKLKLLIVQSSIWIILNDRIFRANSQYWCRRQRALTLSPDHIDGFHAWPEAGEDSEQRRYELVKKYFPATNRSQHGPSGDSRWEEYYEQSLRTAAIDIGDAVETVTNVDLVWAKEIVKFTAEFWMDLASQRYRARLYLPQEATKAQVARNWRSSNLLVLVIRPEVRQRGDAQGQRLNREQVVQRCHGEWNSSDKL